MSRNNFRFLEYSLQLAVAGRVFPETGLGRAVAVGTVYNEMHGLQPSNMLSEVELVLLKVKVKVKVTLRLTVSQSVYLGVEPKSGTFDQRFFFLYKVTVLSFLGRPL
jgi:hypothetical protein